MTKSSQIDSQSIDRMNQALRHRGPDADGVKLFSCGSISVGLGHRRLSIIDLAAGDQPMSNEDGSVWISYNGEIYNHDELRRELEDRGHHFRTRCDTEAIVHAYEEWGTDCLQRFLGMFAFVIWDDREKQLFGARDRLGIKPFYYSMGSDCFICASEAKALFASGRSSANLNYQGLSEFVTFGFIAGEETLFHNVRKLLPGHWILWKDGKLKTHQYWDVPEPGNGEIVHSDAELVAEFDTLFRSSVRYRLMSDVPLGVFLSGGLDSSAIATVMAQQMSTPVKTFSVGFESGYYSEFEFAREVASAIGAEHHEVVLNPEQAFAELPRLNWHEDEPIRFSAAVPLFVVSKLASSHVKVVLTGEGSDELFAGYERYWATLFNLRCGSLYHRFVPSWLHRSLVRPILTRFPLSRSARLKIDHTFLNHPIHPEQIVFDNWYGIFPLQMHHRLFSENSHRGIADINPYQATMQHYCHRREGDTLDRLLYTDQKTYLVELLQKQDKMSMAASIESRVPFLDHRLVEFAARLPSRMKLRGTNGKHIVRQSLQQVLPKSILRRKKMGFPVPLRQWFQLGAGDTVKTVLTSDRMRDRGLFNGTYIEYLLSQHKTGAKDYTEQLWTLLSFEVWARIFLDQQSWESVTDELAAIEA